MWHTGPKPRPFASSAPTHALDAGPHREDSKTYCPFCHRVKGVLSTAVEKSAAAAAASAETAGVTVVELDDLADGDRVQDALQSITGIRTVPQVFIGGNIVGKENEWRRRYSICGHSGMASGTEVVLSRSL